MNRTHLKTWIGLIALVACASFVAWSSLAKKEAQAAASSASLQLEQSKQYAQQIREGDQAPTRVGDQAIERTLLARLMEHATDQAKIPHNALEHIWPQAPQRVGDSPYVKHSTDLLLRDITLQQTALFLLQLTHADRPLDVDSLRLVAKRQNDGGAPATPERWTLEATVSYPIYQPAATAP